MITKEMEKTYWELREEMERANDKWTGYRTNENWQKLQEATAIFHGYCTTILTQLMEEEDAK